MVDILEIESEQSLHPASYTTGGYFVVNFASGDAIKIRPYYQCLGKDRAELLSAFFKDAGINLRQDDLLTMLHLVLLDLALVQPDVDTYFVGNTGFTDDSFNFLKSNISRLAAFDEKKVYFFSFTSHQKLIRKMK